MANRYWVGGSGTWDTTSTANWSTTSGGAAGASTPGIADVAIFDANSGLGTVTLGQTVSILRCLWTGYAGSFQPSTFEINIVGDGASSLWTGGTTATFLAVPTVNFTYAGANSRTVNIGFTDAFTRNINANITAGTGTFNISGVSHANNLNFEGFTGSLTGSNISITGNLTLGVGMTVAANTSSIYFIGTASSTATTNGVLIDRPIGFISTSVGRVVTFTDALVQGATRTLFFSAGTLKLKNGVTSTVGAFTGISGTTQKFLGSSVDGSQATLSQASGTVNARTLTVQDINATGGATWNAYVDFDNEDAGNNDGWNFGLSPPYETYEPPIIIRSFTQPRRF